MSNAGGEGRQWLECGAVREDLKLLGDVLRSAVGSTDSSLQEVSLHLIDRDGKRLRPALLLLARGGDRADDAALSAAAGIELIHLASLYHDDVMDRARLRRGKMSANACWGNAVAALAGTYLFSRSGMLLAPLGDEAMRLAGMASSRLCTGQLREVENAYNMDLSIEEHLEILILKTSALFELPVRLGAWLGRLSWDHSEAIATYARHLGLAFQLVDDLLDIRGSTSTLGKETGKDIKEGVYSLSVLTLLRRHGADARELRLLLRKKVMSDDDVGRAIGLVRESGTVEEGLARARAETSLAHESLGLLPGGPVRRSLAALANLAVDRSQ